MRLYRPYYFSLARTTLPACCCAAESAAADMTARPVLYGISRPTAYLCWRHRSARHEQHEKTLSSVELIARSIMSAFIPLCRKLTNTARSGPARLGVEMKRERPEAAGARLALAEQSGCSAAQPNGKARALPASDDQPVNHDGHGCTMAELCARGGAQCMLRHGRGGGAARRQNARGG